MKRTAMDDDLLENHQSKCRCCFKCLEKKEKAYDVTSKVEKQFFVLTQIELRSSTIYSKKICVDCQKKLADISAFRIDLVSKQQKLYDFVDEHFAKRLKKRTVKMEISEVNIETKDPFEPDILIKEENINEYDELSVKNEVSELLEDPCSSTFVETNLIDWTFNNMSESNEDPVNLLHPIDPMISTSKVKKCPRCCQIIIGSLKKHIRKVHSKEVNCSCDICGYNSFRKDSMASHVTRHIRKEFREHFPCRLCDKVFHSIPSWRSHEKYAHSAVKKTFKCQECFKELASDAGLKFHIRSVHRGIKDTCTLCGGEFANVVSHIRKFHNKKQSKETEVSDSATTVHSWNLVSKAFPNPYGTTRTKNPKFCPDCGKMVMGSVSKHIRQVHLKEVNCICDYCNYSCFRKDNMINHLQKHLMKEVREKFPCLECGTIYTSIFSLKFHQKVKHIEKRTFQCDECGKHLSCRNSLTTHRLTMHTKDDDERFFCSYEGCKKVYVAESILKNHINKCHSSKEFFCEVCGKRFATASKLKYHMVYHETPSFVCEEEGCKKSFFKSISYEIHKKVHSNQRDFACNECDKRYFTASHLKKHVLNFHKQIKVFCELCPSKFARKETYRNHVLSHHRDIGPIAVEALLKKIREMVHECCLAKFRRRNDKLLITPAIQQKFQDLTRAELKLTDEYSKFICHNCFNELNATDKLRRSIMIDSQYSATAEEDLPPHIKNRVTKPLSKEDLEYIKLNIPNGLTPRMNRELLEEQLRNTTIPKEEIEEPATNIHQITYESESK
ncbi:unnamed protein product [Diamesa hyperborea]